MDEKIIRYKNIQLGPRLPTLHSVEWMESEPSKWRFVTQGPPTEQETAAIQRYINAEFSPIAPPSADEDEQLA